MSRSRIQRRVGIARVAAGSVLSILAMSGLAGAVAPAATGRQSLQAIADAARAHVEQLHRDASAEVVVEPGHIDSRLRLKACDKPLEAQLAGPPGRNANTTVRIQCPGAWRLFVPVKVGFRAPVVVLENAVPGGTVLNAGHLATRVVDTNRLAHGYFTDPEMAAGQVLRRPGAPGSVLTPAMLEPAVMIRKGQEVRLVVKARGFRINASGEALSDAVEGQRVRVRNISAQRVVEGVATGPDTVEVR